MDFSPFNGHKTQIKKTNKKFLENHNKKLITK